MGRGKIERICKNCGKLFKTHPSQIKARGALFCSRRCYDQFRRKQVKCQICGKEFSLGRKYRRSGKNIFCSKRCANLFMTKNIDFICKECGIIFQDSPSRRRKFCSKECANKFKIKKEPIERVERTCDWCGKIFIINHAGHRFCSQKCSCSWLTQVRNKGRNHPRYKGNIKQRKQYPPEFFIQRKLIVNKYRGRCFLCNKNARSVHHIDYNIENNNLSNLVLLCSSCHAKTNSNREKWKEFFNNECNQTQ